MADREDKTYSKDNISYFKKKSNIAGYEEYEPVWTTMADVKSRPQPWFWPGMVPDETLTLFAGVGGIGKSLLLLYIVAKTTTGEAFKACGFDCQLPKGSVILLSAEDECDSQIRPKLLGMGADVANVHHIKSKIGTLSGHRKFLELNRDLRILEEKIKTLGDARLIVIDPVSYFIGDVKDHINMEVANFLGSLIELAKQYKLAIVLNKHLRKQAAGARGTMSASSEVGGAGAWTNTPRKCWLVTSHHEDVNVKVISQMKDNLSQNSSNNLAFKIMPVNVEDGGLSIKTTQLVWLDKTVTMTADEAVDKNTYQKGKLEQGIDLIYDYLVKNGQSLVKNIEQFALGKGITSRTFRDAYEQFEHNYRDSLEITKGLRGAKIYRLTDI